MAAERRLFGTDGIRGVANEYPMTADVAVRLGQAIAQHFKTRPGSRALAPGLAAAVVVRGVVRAGGQRKQADTECDQERTCVHQGSGERVSPALSWIPRANVRKTERSADPKVRPDACGSGAGP
jgi:hypothetical protein